MIGYLGAHLYHAYLCVKPTSTVPVVTQQNKTREAATHEGTLCIGAVLLTIVSQHHTLINVCKECGAKRYEEKYI